MSKPAAVESPWFSRVAPDLDHASVAYFCAEFGVRSDLPIYAGGLGVLAGDHARAASDLGVPLIAVGLLYRAGTFRQQVPGDGWQRALEQRVDPEIHPAALQRLTKSGGDDRGAPLAELTVSGRKVALGAWQFDVGQTRLILLDTDLAGNAAEDRHITDRLYGSGAEHRLRQEWVLGAGGVRVLRALGLAPDVWHANEGHAAFMMIERVREHVVGGMPLRDAIEAVRATTVFTTHTPVLAGHDVFATERLDRVCGLLAAAPPIERRVFHAFGRFAETGPDAFHMTAASLRLTGFANGVSRVHGGVARDQWQALWPGRTREQVPITAITNGVHVETWMAPSVKALVDRALGGGGGAGGVAGAPGVAGASAGRAGPAAWLQADPARVPWERIFEIDDRELWQAHANLRRALLDQCREVSRRRWASEFEKNSHLAGGGALLGPRPLTLGFARRFATYKRADLLLRDGERLERLLNDAERPVQLIVAGKAHPDDHGGKMVLQRIWRASRDPRFGGRIAFLEDYDMEMAACLVQGVDVWLNLPRVPLEASGTSGMKAALNGVPQLGTLDGWWAEGFTGRNGWALPRRSAEGPEDDDEIDAADHAALFELLEGEVLPRFHDRDAAGVPRAWITTMKHAMVEALQRFRAQRMVREYCERAYVPMLRGSVRIIDPPQGPTGSTSESQSPQALG